jgi:hypothetical protein
MQSSPPVLQSNQQAIPDTLAASLVGALGEITNPGRDREAVIPGKDGKPGYSYKYADLASLIDHVKPTLAKWGLALIQDVASDKSTVTITTILIHVSGQERSTSPLSMGSGNTPQATGSAITYARRYQAMAVLGLAPDDDDGQAAAGAPYREEDLTPPVISPSFAEAYLARARARGLNDDQIGAIVGGVTGHRTEEVRYLFQTEWDALNAATKLALDARASTTPGNGSVAPVEPSTPPPAMETAPAVDEQLEAFQKAHTPTIDLRDQAWIWFCRCGEQSAVRFDEAEGAYEDHQRHVAQCWKAVIEEKVAAAKQKRRSGQAG